MDNEKAIRAAKLTLGGILEKRRAKTAVERAQGQIAPSKYLPDVPRQVHASGGYVPMASLPIPKLAVASPLAVGQQPGLLDVIGTLNKVAGSARTLSDLVRPEKEETEREPQASRAEAKAEGLTPEASAAMEALRKGWAGSDFGIVSGYRDPEHNERVGGAKDSQHTHGNAYDVDTTGWSPEDKLALADAAWNAGFRGFGFYDNNMHFDVADPRAWGPSYSRDSIPDWAQGWAQERYGYAEGGEVTDLGQVREQKQLQGYHTGMMDDIHQRMSNAMEAHEKAVGQGVFDGYEVGDTLQGSAHPMRITGRYMQKWKPTSMALRSFERMGTEPTIIEHEGEQYIPMLRYETGKEGVDGFQQGSAYLDGVKAAGYQKMGGLRAVKARGGAVEFMRDNHPLVPDELYHGSAPKVATKGWTSEVDEEKTAKNIEAQDFREFRPSEHGNYGPGIYLTDKPEVASDFAQGIRADQTDIKPHGQVMKLHVSMKQPFHDDVLRHPAWKDYIKGALTRYSIPHGEDRDARDAILKALDNDTATVRDLFVRDTPRGTLVNQHGQHDIHDTIRNSGFDGIIAHRPDGSKEYVAFKPEQVKSALSAKTYDPTSPDMTFADGGAAPTMSPLLIEEEMKRDAMKHPDAAAQTGQALDAISNAGRVGSIAGKLTGIPLGGVMGRKLAESIAMSEYGYADGGAAMFEGMHEDLQNEDGTPKELWHGTPHEGAFDEFDNSRLGERDAGFYGRGHYLAPDKDTANEYTVGQDDVQWGGQIVGPLHAALKNPYVWDASDKGAHSTLRDLQSMGIMKGQGKLEPWDNLQRHHIDPFMREMQKRGHDGVVVRTNDYTGEKPHKVSEVVVFKPSAIKHKDAKSFDPNDPNIYHARGGVAK